MKSAAAERVGFAALRHTIFRPSFAATAAFLRKGSSRVLRVQRLPFFVVGAATLRRVFMSRVVPV
jgi:hypothetical protein